SAFFPDQRIAGHEVIPGLVIQPGIQPSTSVAARGPMDPGDKRRDDNRALVCPARAITGTLVGHRIVIMAFIRWARLSQRRARRGAAWPPARRASWWWRTRPRQSRTGG